MAGFGGVARRERLSIGTSDAKRVVAASIPDIFLCLIPLRSSACFVVFICRGTVLVKDNNACTGRHALPVTPNVIREGVLAHRGSRHPLSPQPIKGVRIGEDVTNKRGRRCGSHFLVLIVLRSVGPVAHTFDEDPLKALPSSRYIYSNSAHARQEDHVLCMEKATQWAVRTNGKEHR